MYRSPSRALECPTLGAAVVRTTAALVLALTCVLATGCGKQVSFLGPNASPELTLTSGPVDTMSVPDAWIVDLAWSGTDPDGTIDHFEYALDPPTRHAAFAWKAETTWISTRDSRTTARFRTARSISLQARPADLDFHVFALRAVDDRGGVSPVVLRAFYAANIAPDVRITQPRPSALLRAQVPIPFRIEWVGDDPDGQGKGQGKGPPLAGYRVRLLDIDDPNNFIYLLNPDSLVRQGVATQWQDWGFVNGDTTFFDVTDWTPNRSGMFAVLAVDKAGATTPYLDLNRNFLQFTATLPGTGAPLIHVYSSYVDYTYPSGGYYLDPSRQIPVEIGPAPTVIHWDAIPASGRQLAASRWMLDGDPTDQTPRSSPADLVHWSDFEMPGGSAELPALSTGVHYLYIEVRDNFGEVSLAIVRITVIDAPLSNELLVVDDTRLEVDKFTINHTIPQTLTLLPYTGPWPSATELDTFLVARGGFPWRSTMNPPSGVISSPGLLAGYPFDTLGTRLGLEDPGQAVRLDRLGRYRHVLWIVDDRGATFSPTLDPVIFPMTALRAMSAPGRTSALGSYIELGGQVWLAGGASAYASLVNFDRLQNNVGQSPVFSALLGELGPGRPMYDHAHVRSAMSMTKSGSTPTRSAAAIGGWSGHGPAGTLSAPDYSKLPPAMRLRTPDTDPIPPTRLASQGSLFYVTSTSKEFVLEPNVIVEDFDPKLHVTHLEPALDTLYEAPNPLTNLTPQPVMLYYHGHDNAPFVFTGFDLWSWTREDCQALVDFVLGDIWGLTKSAPAARNLRAVGVATRSTTPAPRSSPVRNQRE